jgi:hypothetical protein
LVFASLAGSRSGTEVIAYASNDKGNGADYKEQIEGMVYRKQISEKISG